jgi:hypothetical protein
VKKVAVAEVFRVPATFDDLVDKPRTGFSFVFGLI